MSKSAKRATSLESKINLPAPQHNSAVSIEKVLLNRRSVREFSNQGLELWHISQLAWAAQGVTGPDVYRTAPSAGALFPLELYVAAGNVDGLPPGVYHYDLRNHALRLLLEGDEREKLCGAALSQDSILRAPAVFILSAVYQRTTAKYGERGIRYVHIETGHAAQNVLLQAVALNLGAVVVGAFDDAKVKKILSWSKHEEPLYLLPVGKP